MQPTFHRGASFLWIGPDFCFSSGMTPDEEIVSEHGLELPSTRRAVRLERKRSHQVMGVAVCLVLTSIIVGAAVVHHQRVSDEHLVGDALQREDLRDGWKTLGAAAALEAQSADTPATASAAPAAATNVVIVNVPGQSGVPAQAPQPSQTEPAVTGTPRAAATGTSNTAEGTPSVTYVAPLTNYGSSLGAGSAQIPTVGVVPSIVPGQSVGNGTIPGSAPNPALPNNGNPSPTPGLPNGTSQLPSGSPNLPSGSSNLPSGSLNLPTGSSNLNGVP